jgi:hypothetical protein
MRFIDDVQQALHSVIQIAWKSSVRVVGGRSLPRSTPKAAGAAAKAKTQRAAAIVRRDLTCGL